MSSQNIPAASQVAVSLIEMRLPDFIKQAILPLIQIPLDTNQLLIGQVTGGDTSFKLTWTCEFSKGSARSKDILIELAYGSYTTQAYAIIPVNDAGDEIDQIRKRKLEVAMKNSMIPCLPLRDISAICKELDALITQEGAFFSVLANYKVYGEAPLLVFEQ